MEKHISICLVSGGIDSALVLAMAREICHDLYVLHLTYGQLTAGKELTCARELAGRYRAKDFKVVRLDWLKEIGGSSLLGDGVVPKGKLPDTSNIPNTYIPFRNGTIASIAASWAEVLIADDIWLGVNALDYSGYIDCRPEFWNAFNKVLSIGTLSKVQIRTPIVQFGKKEIVQKAMSMVVPVHLTWSCYTNEDIACGKCESCVLRRKAFLDAGFDDDAILYVNTMDEFKEMIGYGHSSNEG
jgi:7-cyano-7-deazaguanine synthase